MLPAGASFARGEAEGEWRVTLGRPDDVAAVVAALAAAGMDVQSVIPEQRSLEGVYMSAAGG